MEFKILLHKFNNYIKKLNEVGGSPYQNISLTKKSVSRLISGLSEFLLEFRNDVWGKNKNEGDDFSFYVSLYKQIHSLSSNNPFFEKDGYLFKIKIK